MEKLLLLARKSKKNIFLLKVGPPYLINGFQQQKKKLILFPLAGMKDSLKKMFSLDEKFTSGDSNIWKIMVSTS